jgi:CBS domain-containing protein
MATRPNSQPTADSRLRKELASAWHEIQRLAGEVRLQLHLGGMEAKDAWRAMEPRIKDFERKAAHATEDAGRELQQIGKALAVDLEVLRDGLAGSRRVERIMHTPAITCRATDSLARAAGLMWDHDVGVVMVTGDEGELSGVITDRDIAMAAYTKGRAPGEIAVSDAMAKQLFTCRPSDSIDDAERLMAEHRVRRVPVVNEFGQAVGIVSMNDLIRDASTSESEDGQRGLVHALAAICAPRSSESKNASAERGSA